MWHQIRQNGWDGRETETGVLELRRDVQMACETTNTLLHCPVSTGAKVADGTQ